MINKSESIAELTKAMVAFQAEVATVEKGGANPHFRSTFARLEDAVLASRGPHTKHGLAVMQWLGTDESGRLPVTTLLAHVSGEWIESTYTVDLTKRDPQSSGSASTYARRQAYLAALGLAPSDDDAEGATRTRPEPRAAKKPDNVNALLDLSKREHPGDLQSWWKQHAADPAVRRQLWPKFQERCGELGLDATDVVKGKAA